MAARETTSGTRMAESPSDFDYFSSLDSACAGNEPIEQDGRAVGSAEIERCPKGQEVERVSHVIHPDDTGPILVEYYRRPKDLSPESSPDLR